MVKPTASGLLTFGFGCALAALSPALSVWAEEGTADDRGGEQLRIPGMPPLQLPPGVHAYGPGQGGDGRGTPRDSYGQGGQDRGIGHSFGYRGRGNDMPSTVIGPGGVVKPMPRPNTEAKRPPPKALTPEERADRIRKALAPRPPLAEVRRKTLDDLYTKLAAAKDPDEAKGLASLIAGIWMRSGSDTGNLLMLRASQAIDKKDYATALDVLDKLVELQPGWAEAWNKRAAVRFYRNNLDGAMSDVEHVLKLEPKHFGALGGMGAMLQRAGLDKRALEVFRRSLEIYPQQPDMKKLVDKLTLQVEGQGI